MIARAPRPVPLILSSRLGLVSIPSAPAGQEADAAAAGRTGFSREEGRALLQGLGRALGLTVLESAPAAFPEASDSATVPAGTDATGDGGLPGERGAFFAGDEAVHRALQGLDAVWMDGEAPVAAFVLESGIGGWQGLRRLADVLALHPKLKAPLYAITVPAARSGLEAEARRPVYRLLKRPLADDLRVLDWERLKSEVDGMGERVRYLRPEFLEGIADRMSPPADEA